MNELCHTFVDWIQNILLQSEKTNNNITHVDGEGRNPDYKPGFDGTNKKKERKARFATIARARTKSVSGWPMIANDSICIQKQGRSIRIETTKRHNH